jgi:hypothetical protein
MERSRAGDRERQPRPAAPPDDARAHATERLHHPVHGAAAERLVAGEHRRERLARQHADQEPHRRPGVAAVHDVARLGQTLEPDALDHEVAGPLARHLGAERLDGLERPEAVLALEEALHLGEAVGDGA